MGQNDTPSLQERLAELQEIFHQQLPAKLDEIRQSWQQLQANWDDKLASTFHRLAHSLAGSGGTFGAPEISRTARALEQRMKIQLGEGTAPDENAGAEIQQLVDELLVCGETWDPAKLTPSTPANALAPENLKKKDDIQENLIFIVEDDELIATQFSELFSDNGYQVQCFATPDAFATACREVIPSVVIMDMVFAEGSTAGADIINRVCEKSATQPNIIFVSIRNDMEARLAAFRAGAQRYFSKPVNHSVLLDSIDKLTGRSHHKAFRVLLVDDDDTLAQYHSELLEMRGIETLIINNPMMTLEIIDEFQPELILMDIYMESCNGTELAAVIRQDDRLAQLPIVFLSEELDTEYQLSALHHGGDDFITKPINPEYFVELVLARLKRSRTISELSEQLSNSLQESKYLQLAIDKHSIVSIADTNGNISFVNDKFCEISKYDRDELLGRNHRIVKSGRHPKSFFDAMWADITAGKVWHGVIENRAKDGSNYWVDSTIVPFLDTEGLPYKYVSIRTDITNIINSQNQMQLARDEAEEANRAKSRFLSSMSHELRTPLNAILGFAQLMEMDELNDEQHSWVKDILKGGNHLLKLVNDVLDLSKIEAGHIELSLEPVSVQYVIEETEKLLNPLFQSYRVSFKNEVRNDAVVRADLTRFKQVMINLISNAAKYNVKDGSIRVSCSTTTDERTLRIRIQDSGKGIAAEKLPQLFEPFNRLDAEGGSIEGTGIGLTICKDLIEVMGGTIGVDSEPGHGSTFWIELPIDVLPATTDVADNEIAQTPQDAENPRVYDVLYIEDNPVNLRLVTMVMGKRPHIRLHTAHEPLLGLGMAEADPPDLILLDINLPGIDGYEVLRRLKSMKETKNIPVIAVSANALEDDINRGIDSGFTHYVTKPINVKQFTQTIDEVLFTPPEGT